MSKYIDFDIAVRKLGTWYNDFAEANGSDDDFVKGYGEAMDDLADVPAADVQEVKHGKWDEIRDGYGKIEGWIHKECGQMSMRKDEYCSKKDIFCDCCNRDGSCKCGEYCLIRGLYDMIKDEENADGY